MKIGQLLGTGMTANVYQWGKNEVIKIFHDQSFAMSEAKRSEFINNLKLRTPYYSGLIEYEGKTGIIYERIEGPTMLRLIEPTKQSISYYAKQMAQLQFEVHNVKVDVPSNLRQELTKKVNESKEIANEEKQIIVDILSTLPNGNTICHYDFHPDNIIISPNGPIIFDWANLLVGNQEADVARSSMILQSHSLPPNVPNWLIDRELREFFHEEYLSEYMNLSGMNDEFLERWMIPTLAVRINEMEGEYRKEIKDKLELRLKI